MDSIQVGKAVFALPWESNPGPTPIRGGMATLIASVSEIALIFKDICISYVLSLQRLPGLLSPCLL